MCCRCAAWHARRGQRVIFWNPLSPSTLKWDLGINPRLSELHRKSLYLLTHFASPLLFHLLVVPAREGRCFSPRKVSSGGDWAKNARSLARPLQFCFESGLSLPLAYLISIYFWPQAPWETEVSCYWILFLNQTRSKILKVLSRKNVVKVLVFYTIWLDMWSVRFSCYRILDLFSSWD